MKFPSDEDLEWLYPSCLLFKKKGCCRAFRSIANKRYKWCVTKSNYLAMTNLLTGWEKKTYLLFAYVGAHFSCKIMHSRDAWCSGTNWPWNKLIRRCFMRKGKSSLATINESVGSNIMFWSNYFCSFVFMQVDLLNICVGQRWNAMMKSRVWVTL